MVYGTVPFIDAFLNYEPSTVPGVTGIYSTNNTYQQILLNESKNPGAALDVIISRHIRLDIPTDVCIVIYY